MRLAIVMAGCAGCAAPAVPHRVVEPPPPVVAAPDAGSIYAADYSSAFPAPALAAFTQPGDVFMLVLDGDRPTCEAWTVEPDEPTHGRLIRDRVALQYHSSGSLLEIKYVLRFEGALPAWTPSSSTEYGREVGDRCDLAWGAAETADAIEVGDARWFRSATACASAIASKQRVATDLSRCLPRLPARGAADTRAQFERVLDRGGVVFEVIAGHCTETRVEATTGDIGDLHGIFVRIDDDNADRRIESLEQYHAIAGGNWIGLAGAGSRTIKKRAGAWDNGSFSTMCGHQERLAFGDGEIAHGAASYFVSAAACRAALPRIRARAAWFASAADSPGC